LLQSLTFAGIVKALCVMSNILVQVSPFPAVRRWETRGDTGGADAAPYVSIAFGGWQWCFYGAMAWLITKRSGFLILIQSNCLGALLGTYYTVAFWRQCQSESARLNLCKYLSAVAGLVMFEFCALMVLSSERGLFLVGLVAAFCGFVGAMSVLVTVPGVIKSKDARSIPGPIVTANMFCCTFWSICGVLLDDPLITAPSLTQLCASTTCVYLKLVYPSSPEEPSGKCGGENPFEVIKKMAKVPGPPT